MRIAVADAAGNQTIAGRNVRQTDWLTPCA